MGRVFARSSKKRTGPVSDRRTTFRAHQHTTLEPSAARGAERGSGDDTGPGSSNLSASYSEPSRAGGTGSVYLSLTKEVDVEMIGAGAVSRDQELVNAQELGPDGARLTGFGLNTGRRKL